MKTEQATEDAAPSTQEVEADGASLIEYLLVEARDATGPLAAPVPCALQAPLTSEPSTRIDGVVIGFLVGFAEGGAPRVDYAGNPASEPLEARSMVPLGDAEIAREVALLFEGGDPRRPLVMGLVQKLVPRAVTAPRAVGPQGVEVTRDGERAVIEAEEEIVLRCGKASITLTKAGKVLIRGAYVLARATGVNRIQGGSVQIN